MGRLTGVGAARTPATGRRMATENFILEIFEKRGVEEEW
jgi:hypothetical protein